MKLYGCKQTRLIYFIFACFVRVSEINNAMPHEYQL